MNFKNFNQNLLSRLPSHASINPATIVDDVLLLIQNDPDLFNLYIYSWKASQSNPMISKFIKSHYELTNLTVNGVLQKNYTPKSHLIKSYQMFQ